MKKILLLIAGMALLKGCAETVYRTKLEVYCPPLKQYSQEFNEELSVELDVLQDGYTAIPMVVSDYVKLRDEVKACQKERDKNGD
jgi:hypothetical protein